MAEQPGFQISRDHEQQLRGMVQPIQDLEEFLAKAERAGIDVSAQRAELEAVKRQREGILREFGTPRP